MWEQGAAPEQLIHVQLDEGDWNGLLLLAVLPESEYLVKYRDRDHLVDSLRDILQHQVQVDLVLTG